MFSAVEIRLELADLGTMAFFQIFATSMLLLIKRPTAIRKTAAIMKNSVHYTVPRGEVTVLHGRAMDTVPRGEATVLHGGATGWVTSQRQQISSQRFVLGLEQILEMILQRRSTVEGRF